MINLFPENFFSRPGFILVDFYADWCEPCKYVPAILDEIKIYFGEKINVEKIDIDEFSDLAKGLHILSVPTLILYKNGEEVWRMKGFDVAPKMIKTLSPLLT